MIVFEGIWQYYSKRHKRCLFDAPKKLMAFMCEKWKKDNDFGCLGMKTVSLGILYLH